MEAPPALRAVLEDARAQGFLGPGPVDEQVQSGLGFLEVIGEGAERVLDLGSGGGVPGLVLAGFLPTPRLTLLEVGRRRAAFLRAAVGRLGWHGRVEVVEERAEEAARDPARRGRFPIVVARSFGPPPVAAECGAPFLTIGGRLIVAEPPEEMGRWPVEALGLLGLAVEDRVVARNRSFEVLRQVSRCPDRFPRRTGVPAKRPLF